MKSSLFVKNKITRYKKIRNSLIFLVLLIGLIAVIFVKYIVSPIYLSSEKSIHIPEGYSVIQTGELLASEGVVRSGLLFRVLVQLQGNSVKAGTYLFSNSVAIYDLIDRINTANYGDVYISVTLPEGATLGQMANIFDTHIEGFNKEEFLSLTSGKEGYLFPDTYSFLPGDTTQDVIDALEKRFNLVLREFESDIINSPYSREDIIIMASLIEKEATSDLEERKKVSGILWKRLQEGMLLQVDAPFQYIHGTVRAADLRKDGPYNTYTRKGLTPTPIGNPGKTAINAALNPTDSAYYFYLHGKDGVVRYAVNYNQHLSNIRKYLR